jgi:hypothetical protein
MDEQEWGKIWPRLAHVCRRWRYVVFGSPVRLDLFLLCTDTTPATKMLDIWPPLPIKIKSHRFGVGCIDNIIAALGHHDRVCDIWLRKPYWELERVVAVMQKPFPALTYLSLASRGDALLVLPSPDSFLGGSAPRLRNLDLSNFPFLTLPKLLLSTHDLVNLQFDRIPHSGYISPEAMATALSTLTRLRNLTVEFESPASRPDRTSRHPLPLTRAVLPFLHSCRFQGVSEYFDDLVARIDAPVLEYIRIALFNELIFDIRHLPRFIHLPWFPGTSSQATLNFYYSSVQILLSCVPEGASPLKTVRLTNSCQLLDWQVSSIAQICTQFSFLLSSVEQLDVLTFNDHSYPPLEVDMDNTQWPELFHPFTAVRTLRIAATLQPLIVPALQEHSGELAVGVLPALESVYIEGYEPSGAEQQDIEAFITARQRSNHPIAAHRWERPELG